MAITIYSPRLSFVQFAFDSVYTGCSDKHGICLPQYQDIDLAFQVVIETDTDAEFDSVMTAPITNFKLKLLNGADILTSSDVTDNTIASFTDTLNFQRIRVGQRKAILYWEYGLPLFEDHIACDECFKIAIDFTIGTTHLVLPSNCFYRKCEECYTSKLEYSCDEDAYGFSYCQATMPNRVRVPIYVSKPQFSDNESVYVRSDGSIKILKSVTKKEYECNVDYLNADMHERLKVALSHDNVLLTSETYTGGIRKDGNYEINWQDLNYDLAPAGFKAFTTPYLVRNDNCEVCDILCGVIQTINTSVSKNESSWNLSINSFSFIDNPSVIQSESVYYRQGGSSGAFTLLSTIDVNTDGSIAAPLAINDISNAWDSVEIKVVNQDCNNQTSETVNKPEGASVTVDCDNIIKTGAMVVGTASTVHFTIGITVTTPGSIHVVAECTAIGTGGPKVSGEADIDVIAGQTSIDMPANYDGSFLSGTFDMVFTITDSTGDQTCEKEFSM